LQSRRGLHHYTERVRQRLRPVQLRLMRAVERIKAWTGKRT
jgi:hypothetical protein